MHEAPARAWRRTPELRVRFLVTALARRSETNLYGAFCIRNRLRIATYAKGGSQLTPNYPTTNPFSSNANSGTQVENRCVVDLLLVK